MPPPITSFYHAIYKRLWAIGVKGDAHTTIVAGDGNFSLNSPGPPHGIFGSTDYGAPLALGNYVAANNPLWVILNASFNPPPPPGYLVSVPGYPTPWPTMPWPGSGPYPLWDQWNAAAPPLRLIDRLQHWIEVDHQLDDTPGGSHLEFTDWSSGPALVPQVKGKEEQVLFVCSVAGDNGVRPGNVKSNNYWNTSQIFVCDDHGKNIGLPTFKAGEQRTIQAIIGNSSSLLAGSLFNLPPVQVQCNAYAFNTFLSDAVPLPEMSALDAPNAGFTYEQVALMPTSYAVAGFRFDVDQVFQSLSDKMKAHNYTAAQLGFPTVDDWLKANAAHACVKVLVRANEYPNNQMGNFPSDMALPTADRHIAQRNLAGFDMSVVAMKKIKWQYFMMSQAGEGLNALSIDSHLPADAARFYFAVPSEMFRRHIAQGAKGAGNHRGFEVVTGADKAFADGVILRRTSPDARLSIADHKGEPFFGMALGIEGDPARLKSARVGDISVVHARHDGHVVGGFTLRPQVH